MLSVGSLFSGIGGFDLGLERAGMRVLWQCEQDDFCRRVLARHWPHVRCYDDVRELRRDDVEPVDVLCGGFPCQDLSYAGKGAGIDGARSGLWSEYARLIGELRPRYVIVENVSALLGRGLGRVLGDLAACGYDAEWDCLPASAVGAPHQRDRIWLVAYPNGDDGGARWARGLDSGGAREPESLRALSSTDANGGRQQERQELDGESTANPTNGCSRRRHTHGLGDEVADTNGAGLEGHGRLERRSGERPPAESGSASGARALADPEGQRVRPGLCTGESTEKRRGRSGYVGCTEDAWATEPDVGRVAHGVPARVDRLRSLGNALVPQIAEWLGRRIIEWELNQ